MRKQASYYTSLHLDPNLTDTVVHDRQTRRSADLFLMSYSGRSVSSSLIIGPDLGLSDPLVSCS